MVTGSDINSYSIFNEVEKLWFLFPFQNHDFRFSGEQNEMTRNGASRYANTVITPTISFLELTSRSRSNAPSPRAENVLVKMNQNLAQPSLTS